MWKFLSRGYGETEGFSNGSLAEFKGNPLQALAREICQNSLDAADGSGKPVIVEFESIRMSIDEFPGMVGMRDVIKACKKFWSGKGDVNTATFLNEAVKSLKPENKNFTVLRVSDYNTTGVCGAFSDEVITPWGGLVKGNAFSVKQDTSNAAGSYGIGKAAPFVSSRYQTVFYRTLDIENTRAALGVARLMAHESITAVKSGEDIIRRSVGYYGLQEDGKPSHSFKELDKLNVRNSCGTDIFIPGFTGETADDKWVKDILKEIVDNFLMSIYYEKLEVHIQKRILNKRSLADMLDFIGSKDAKIFYQALRNSETYEENYAFHGLGNLHLRLLYSADLNKKVLVVRSSGMKIARIKSLPRTISYTGILELQGNGINSFFREMENPSHTEWEPRRHGNPTKAREYKEELEAWVISKITERLLAMSGDECDIDVGDNFNYTEDNDGNPDKRKQEQLTDDSDPIKYETYIPKTGKGKKISIRDEGRSSSSRTTPAEEDPNGTHTGTRSRHTDKTGGKKTGRKVTPKDDGPDTAYVGEGGKEHEVYVNARIIGHGVGENKLIFTAEEDITQGRIEIVTKGENGKSLKLRVKSVNSDVAGCDNGIIVIRNVKANEKQSVIFTLTDNHSYALGVKAYGN